MAATRTELPLPEKAATNGLSPNSRAEPEILLAQAGTKGTAISHYSRKIKRSISKRDSSPDGWWKIFQALIPSLRNVLIGRILT
jgi:hypothetical protein